MIKRFSSFFMALFCLPLLLAQAEPIASSGKDISRALGGDYWKPEAQRTRRAPSISDAAKRAPAPRLNHAHLIDLLRNGEHHFAYHNMLATAHVLPRWFNKFTRDGDGVSMPVGVKTISGRRYEFAQICKPRDATGSCVLVVFDVATGEGPVAWGLISDGDSREWVGFPPSAVRQVAEAFYPS